MQVAIPKFNDCKSQLRTSLRGMLRASQPSSRLVCDALDRWLANQHGLRTIAVYAALPGEVDLSEFVARHPERCWVYPRVDGDELTFHAVGVPATELTAGAFGIREPVIELVATAVELVDAFLCPGLAFDDNGGRLGRGRGFYDRVLSRVRPGVLKVGVCFALQIVPDTFSESHDVRMDAIICA